MYNITIYCKSIQLCVARFREAETQTPVLSRKGHLIIGKPVKNMLRNKTKRVKN